MLMRPYHYINKSYWPYFGEQPVGIEYIAMAIKERGTDPSPYIQPALAQARTEFKFKTGEING